MSGGHFDYKQYHITCIADELKNELAKQGIERERKRFSERWIKDYQEDRYYPNHPVEINEAMKEAIKLLDRACIYVQRLDWYFSGDDGLESFKTRLKEELETLKNKQE